MFIAAVALVASFTALQASDVEGLFVMGNERAESQPKLKSGDLALPSQAVRLTVTRAVFRADTEDKARYWLEIDIARAGAPRNPDPGDFYLFRIDGKDYRGFSTRGRINDAGWRWALSLTDADAGRALLEKIGKAYGLAEGQIQDQSKKGKQTDAGGRRYQR